MVDKNKNGIGTMSLCKEEIKPGEGIPVHKHLNEAESIYIQQGSGVFTLYDKEYAVQAGSAAFVPKGVWHGLQNTGSESLVMVFSFSPSGFEGYFREIGVPPGVAWKQKTNEEFAAAAKKYGIQYRDF
jgi:oxalate decarboxylase/phosphoglucose isomerase-like protein (cupin superfamily)